MARLDARFADEGGILRAAQARVGFNYGYGRTGLVLLPREHYRSDVHFLVLDRDVTDDAELFGAAVAALGGAEGRTMQGWSARECDIVVLADLQ